MSVQLTKDLLLFFSNYTYLCVFRSSDSENSRDKEGGGYLSVILGTMGILFFCLSIILYY